MIHSRLLFGALVTGLAVVGAPALAQSTDDLSYSYIEGGVSILDVDGADSDTGFNVRASAELAENFYFQGSWDQVDLGFFDVDIIKAGVGFHAAMSANTDWFAELSYLKLDTGFADDDGGRADLGVRSALTDNLEGRVYVGYATDDFSEGDVIGGADLLIKFTDQFGISVGAETYEFDVTTYRGNLRISF